MNKKLSHDTYHRSLFHDFLDRPIDFLDGLAESLTRFHQIPFHSLEPERTCSLMNCWQAASFNGSARAICRQNFSELYRFVS